MKTIQRKSLAGFLAVTGLLLTASSARVTHPDNKNYSNYSSLEVYDGTFDSFIYVEEYQNHRYLILYMYYDKLQPYIINTGEFVQRLENTISFKLLNNGKPIPAIA